MAYEDRASIMDYIAQDNPGATLKLDEEIEAKTDALVSHPKRYKLGRMKDTREMVIRPNYVVVYRDTPAEVTILRVLHAARQWP
jgi:addiction module RelE/StbE family toxin